MCCIIARVMENELKRNAPALGVAKRFKFDFARASPKPATITSCAQGQSPWSRSGRFQTPQSSVGLLPLSHLTRRIIGVGLILLRSGRRSDLTHRQHGYNKAVYSPATCSACSLALCFVGRLTAKCPVRTRTFFPSRVANG